MLPNRREFIWLVVGYLLAVFVVPFILAQFQRVAKKG